MGVRSAARRVRARQTRTRSAGRPERATPYLSLVRAPATSPDQGVMGRRISVSTYNVHRWTPLNGRKPDASRAGLVISELRSDVIALQEVLRPFRGEDPLEEIARGLGLHVAFAATRIHRRGELGNAILSRWPMTGVFVVDLTFSRMERRLAVAAQFQFDGRGVLDVVATHLALGDRTRHRQVRSLLDHPHFQGGPTVLLGDMNAYRRCAATRVLERELHNNLDWPPSFPAARPVLALDRIYSRGAKVLEIESHISAAARRASDHLPVTAHVQLPTPS